MEINKPPIYEHEKIAFLDEDSHDRISAYLSSEALDLGQDDKTSYFFVLPDLNLSVASKRDESVIKLKVGQIGRGVGHRELPEVALADANQTQNAVDLLTELTGHTPQVSEQLRHNYKIDDVEVAVKYTEVWGFHAELECLYEGGDVEKMNASKAESELKIQKAAGMLGIELATDEELVAFTSKFESDKIPRGEYSSAEIRRRYTSLYKMALMKRLPAQQFMDMDTLSWIDSNRPEDLLGAQQELLLSQTEENLVKSFSFPSEWFSDADRSRSIHGQLHLFRTAAIAASMARTAHRTEDEAQTLFVAGLFHDIARTHDQDDPDHAGLSAKWFSENATTMNGELGEYIKGISFEKVDEIIRAHDGSVDSVSDDTIWAVHCLRTADALDRYRLPKVSWWIDDSYLNLKPENALKTTAFSVMSASERTFLESGDISKATAQILNFCLKESDAS